MVDVPPEQPAQPADPPAPDAPVDLGPTLANDPPADPPAPATHFVTISPVDPTVANPRTVDGDEPDVKLTTHDGRSFFYTVANLPARFLDEARNVITGRHDNVTVTHPANPTPEGVDEVPVPTYTP